MFEILVCNLEPDGYKIETLGGREFIVCNAVILTEGVHTGTEGPGYYSKEVLGKDPERWDGSPVTHNHPKGSEGKYISANSPGVLANIGLGQMFETVWDGKLRTKVWIDRVAADFANKIIVQNIKKKIPVELSTGLKPYREKVEGVFNEEKYKWKLLDYLPDHLAILPKGEGACSVKKGCGLIANCSCKVSNPEEKMAVKTKKKGKAEEFDKAEWIDGLIGNGWEDDDREWLEELDEEKLKKLHPVVANEGEEDEDEDEEEEEVVVKPKKKVVANTAPVKKVKKKVKIVANEPDDDDDDDDEELDPEEWLKKAPKSMKAVWNHAVEVSEKERGELVQTIIANCDDEYEEEELAEMDVKQLRKLAKIATKVTANSSGRSESVRGFLMPGRTNFGLAAGTISPVVGNTSGKVQRADKKIKPLRLAKPKFASPFGRGAKAQELELETATA